MRTRSQQMPKQRCRGGCLLGLGFILLGSGCQTSERNYGQPDEEALAWRQTAEQGRDRVPVPPVVDTYRDVTEPDTLQPVVEPPPPLPTTPVHSLAMTEALELGEFFRAMALGAEVNLLVGESVAGTVRLNLSNETTWDRLFETVVETHGFVYEWDGEILQVMGQADVARQTAMETALQARESAREARLRAEAQQMAIYRVRYADVQKLSETLLAGLTDNDTGAANIKVIADADSGLLILHAPPLQMRRMLRLAEEIDQPAYQILLEATIVQTNSETARDLGMQWGALGTNTDGGRLTTYGSGINSDNWVTNFPANGVADGIAGSSFRITRETANEILQVQLTALQKDGRLRIVSNPSITTLDKQKAVIESGEERPFQSASGSGAATTPVVEYKEALLSVEVTPQVIDGQWIKLAIRTAKDDFDDTGAVLIDGTLQVPIITRTAETMLYLANGQTTVIGGLSTTSETDGETGVPFFKDIPLLGQLFRSDSRGSSFSDTLIFITPTILGNLPTVEAGQ